MSGTRTLFVLRHAKSAWDDPDKRDCDRPLTVRGIQNAERMGQELQPELQALELILTSPASRALHTAVLLAQAAGLPTGIIRISERLYEASPRRVHELVLGLPEGLACAMIVGHNPTFTYFVNEYLPDPLDNLPTAGLVRLSFGCPAWADIAPRHLVGSAYHYPRMYTDFA